MYGGIISINYFKPVIMCYSCNISKDRCDFRYIRKKYPHHGQCKQCYSTEKQLAYMARKAEKYPHNYLQCDECDKIFSKNYASYKHNKVCPFCGLEGVYKYNEQ